MKKIPTIPTVHPDMWVYDVEYADTKEFRRKGFNARHVHSQMSMPEIMYLCRAPHAITVLSMGIVPDSLYCTYHQQ